MPRPLQPPCVTASYVVHIPRHQFAQDKIKRSHLVAPQNVPQNFSNEAALGIVVFGKRQRQEREGGSEVEDTTTSSIQLFSLIRLGLFYAILFPFFY